MSRSVVISRSITPTGDAFGNACSTDRHATSSTSCAIPAQPTTHGQPSVCDGSVGARGGVVLEVGVFGIDMFAMSCADMSCADMSCDIASACVPVCAVPPCIQGRADVLTENTNSNSCITANTRRRDRSCVPFISRV